MGGRVDHGNRCSASAIPSSKAACLRWRRDDFYFLIMTAQRRRPTLTRYSTDLHNSHAGQL
jgi:hypothetical protein